MKPIMHGYQPLARRNGSTPGLGCDQLGGCQGRKTPCLNCTAPGSEPWPAARDTYRLSEWLTCPLVVAAVLGFAIGIVYGLVRYCAPGLFS